MRPASSHRLLWGLLLSAMSSTAMGSLLEKVSLSSRPRHLMDTSTGTLVPGPSISATAALASSSQCPLAAPFTSFSVPTACLSSTEFTQPLRRGGGRVADGGGARPRFGGASGGRAAVDIRLSRDQSVDPCAQPSAESLRQAESRVARTSLQSAHSL